MPKQDAQQEPLKNHPAAEDQKTFGRKFENKHQFEEAVNRLLKEHVSQRPKGIFY
jgi:hypothetical protein